jgi:predicted CoA-binding protein
VRGDADCYRSLADVPADVRIDAVNLVVAPRVGLEVLRAMAQRGIQRVFARLRAGKRRKARTWR